jgi:CheY-like chemotaxis protein
MTPAPPLEILLVEDNPGDVRLTQEAIKDAPIAHNLRLVTTGEEALDYVYRRGPYSAAPKPDVILLDLCLPGIAGQQVLAQLKSDAALRTIPIVVLTSSRAEKDVLESRNLRANAYVVKPVDLEQFTEVIRGVQEFWKLNVVKLPKT